MLEAWSAATLRVKCLNLTSLLLTFLAFLSCCISFGAELFTAQSTDTSLPQQLVFHFYHDRVESRLGYSHFADLYQYRGDNNCTNGGRVLVAFAALAFITTLALLTLTLCRILSPPLRWLPPPSVSLRIELWLSVLSAPLLLLSVAPYASLCYQSFQSNRYFVNVRATGYGYSIAGVLIGVGQMGVCWVVRRDERCWLGVVEGSSEYWSSKARGEGDGYQEEKLSGFEEREKRARGAVEADEDDRKEEEEDRRHKRGRSKSHRIKGKHHNKHTKVYIGIPLQPIDPNYNYSSSYQASDQL